ncbi:hypothetical protein VTN02DRAFT_1175 [Thermoascus thermophilus]
MSVAVVALWLFVLVHHGRAVWDRAIMYPGRDEDVRNPEKPADSHVTSTAQIKLNSPEEETLIDSGGRALRDLLKVNSFLVFKDSNNGYDQGIT